VVAGLPDTSEVSPVTVDYRQTELSGARYRQRGERGAPVSCRKTTRKLSAFYSRMLSVSPMIRGNGTSGVIGKGRLPVDQEHYHPFGHSFILFPWVHSEPIDYGERKRIGDVGNHRRLTPCKSSGSQRRETLQEAGTNSSSA